MTFLPSRVSVANIAMESIYSYIGIKPKFNDNNEKTVCKIVKMCTKKLNIVYIGLFTSISRYLLFSSYARSAHAHWSALTGKPMNNTYLLQSYVLVCYYHAARRLELSHFNHLSCKREALMHVATQGSYGCALLFRP